MTWWRQAAGLFLTFLQKKNLKWNLSLTFLFLKVTCSASWSDYEVEKPDTL